MPPLDSLSTVAGVSQNPDGTWGLSQVGPATGTAAPTAGTSGAPGAATDRSPPIPTVTVRPSTPAAALPPTPVSAKAPAAPEAPDLATAAGLVQLPDGTWGAPAVAAQAPPIAAPAAPGAPTDAAAGTPPGTPPAVPAAVPPSVEAQELRNQPWYQGIYDGVLDGIKATTGAVATATHGMTLGLSDILDPIVPAAIHSVETGTPFTQSYQLAQHALTQPRMDFQQQHPAVATGINVAAGIPAAVMTGPLFGAAAKGAPAAQRVLMAMRNLAAGTGTGAMTGATMTDGNLQQRLQGAKQGAATGGLLSALAPVVATVGRAIAAPFQAAAPLLRPQAAAEGAAGGALLDAAGGTVPTMQPPPIAGMTQDVAQASNNPGLASVVRLRNETDQGAAVAQRTAQNAEVRQGALAGTPASGPLARQMPVPDASGQLVTGMQRASDVLRTEERRRWSVPDLAAMQPDLQVLKDRVRRVLGSLPLRVQRAIENNADLRSTLADLQDMQPGATLADVNDIRSDLLSVARTLPKTEGLARNAAGKAAQAVLDGLESNPAMRTNPRAWAAYTSARNYSRRMWEAMGHDEFQSMLRTNRYGNQAGDVGTMAGRVFNTGAGTEVTPGGVAGIGRMLDQVQRQWSALRTSGVTGLDPSAVAAARTELTDGARNYIINRMLDDASSITLDQTGQPLLRMNKLADWIDTNRAWIGRSGLFNPDQLDALDRVRQAAQMVQRTENLRGGANSATFERLAGDKFLDAFLHPLSSAVTGAGIGAIALGTLGHLVGEGGLGVVLGAEVGGGVGLGSALLRRLYDMPRARALALIDQAIRDPQIAHDLMRKADIANARKFSPATVTFLRAIAAEQPAGQAMRVYGPGTPDQAGSSVSPSPGAVAPGAGVSP